MKKLITIITVLLLLLLCCACENSDSKQEPQSLDEQEPLIVEEEPKEIVMEYDSIVPEKYAGRLLSDKEIASLSWKNIDKVREKISTVEDAAAWISSVECVFCDGAAWCNTDVSPLLRYPSIHDVFGKEYTDFSGGLPSIGKDTVNMIAAWLLQDDVPGVGTFFALPRVFNGLYGFTSTHAVTFLAIDEDEGTTLIDINRLIPDNEVWAPVPINGEVIEDYNALLVLDMNAFARQFDLRFDDLFDVKYFSDIVYINDFDSDIEYKQVEDLGSAFTIRNGIKRIYSNCSLTDDSIENYVVSRMVKKDLPINHFRVNDYGDETICNALGDATISEKDAEGLNEGSIEEAAEKIKTLADLMIYLHAGGYKFGRSDIWQRDLDNSNIIWHFNTLAETSHEIKIANCGATSALATYMLQGDYEEIGFVCHTYPVGGGGGHVYNYIKHNGFYYVFDLTTLTGNWYEPASFMFIRMSKLDDYAELYKERTQYDYLPIIYAYNSLREIPLAWGEDYDDTRVTWFPTGTELYVIKEDRKNGYYIKYRDVSKNTMAEIERALTPGYASIGYLRVDEKPKIKLPKALSGATMSYEEIMELAHLSPKEKADRVKTVEDALLLFRAMGVSYGGGDLSCQAIDGDVWHFNSVAQKALQKPEQDCGESSNSLRYLLDGDYDEVGIISCTWANGEGGGHVFNYIYTGGKYYVVDFTSYTNDNYNPNAKAVIELNSLDDFTKKWKTMYNNKMKVAYSTTLMSDIPVKWSGMDVHVSGIPEKYRDDIHIIFQSEDEGYVVEFVSMSEKLENAINDYRSR